MDKVFDHSCYGVPSPVELHGRRPLLLPLLLRQEGIDVLRLQGQAQVAGEVAPEA